MSSSASITQWLITFLARIPLKMEQCPLMTWIVSSLAWEWFVRSSLFYLKSFRHLERFTWIFLSFLSLQSSWDPWDSSWDPCDVRNHCYKISEVKIIYRLVSFFSCNFKLGTLCIYKKLISFDFSVLGDVWNTQWNIQCSFHHVPVFPPDPRLKLFSFSALFPELKLLRSVIRLFGFC